MYLYPTLILRASRNRLALFLLVFLEDGVVQFDTGRVSGFDEAGFYFSGGDGGEEGRNIFFQLGEVLGDFT